MGRTTFEGYGRRAGADVDATTAGGRYPVQAEAARLIAGDVVAKLDLDPRHNFLDIGCGGGQVLVPVSYLVRSATGIDHPDVVEWIRRRHADPALRLIGGNFFDLAIDERFDRILSYGVVQCLASADEVEEFVLKAASLLAPDGRLLIGDLPNVDLKRRFMETATGRAFHAEWLRLKAAAERDAAPEPPTPTDAALPHFDDALMLRLVAALRSRGFSAYLLPQSPALPFGNSREDLLACRPPA